jgi:nucleotide-binding universal stress UspA family protein
MAMFEKVLVAVDLSDHGRKVLEVAKDLALKTKSEIRVVHVEEMGFIGRAGQVPLETREEVGEVVAAAVADLERAGLKATGTVRAAQMTRIAKEIAAEATEQGASMIVVGAHGHGGRDAGLLGSTADRLVHVAEVLVLVVP